VERPEAVYHWAGNRRGRGKTRVRVLEIEGLEIKEKYCAVKIAAARPGPLLINRFCALAELFTDGGEPLPFTMGFDPKSALDRKEARWSRGTLETTGVNFEFNFGFPTFGNGCVDMTSWWAVQSPRNFAAFCRGKSPCMFVLSLAHKESRNFILSLAKTCLEKGVDGIDLRFNSHSTTFEPRAYGFNAPAVEEFRRRYGVDVLTQDFDRVAWEKLHGEYVTQLVREVSGLLHSQGKKCQVHLGHYCRESERVPAYMNRCYDWKTWLKERLVDEVTHKDNPLESPHCREVRAQTEKLGIPFYECRAHSYGRPREEWAELQGRAARAASAFGLDGANLYENCVAVRLGGKPGQLEITAPGIAEVIRGLQR
jgi:hypothetical protein